ncbi:DUF2063 domain-containing protein [Roseovarius sp. A21]|uniref:DUF2063 domain-containing protein n=1 Tax=Roseovarius bejariae TaxID=2576383 RepID=A0A844CSK2_9RHOB|nr:DNA-binding domain-containing protein [Roseovarius bejariae]MRU16435.1 DUF2063 domain-containing protein [Roseovarius bejariae]
MTVDQDQFHDALLDNTRPVPSGLRDGQDRPAGARFSVYRNNVAVSLTEALEVSFPAVVKLIGPENFKRVAGLFLRQHPPTSPMIMYYGANFSDFLEKFEPLQHLGYLADVARLEQALRESYHAADSTPVAPAALSGLSDEKLSASRIILAPTLRVVRSSWPVHAIWSYTLEDGAPKPHDVAQDVLVTRPAYDPTCHVLSSGGGAFVSALMSGATMEDAFEIAVKDAPDLDLAGLLTLLLDTSSITEVQAED